MMLLGLAFENVVKGILVRKHNDIVLELIIDFRRWKSRGGHGIREIILTELPNLNDEEIDLLERLEEHIIWNGKYPVPKRAEDYVQAYIPNPKLTLISTDRNTAKEIFRKLRRIYL